jgi:hypothetical protein
MATVGRQQRGQPWEEVATHLGEATAAGAQWGGGVASTNGEAVAAVGEGAGRMVGLGECRYLVWYPETPVPMQIPAHVCYIQYIPMIDFTVCKFFSCCMCHFILWVICLLKLVLFPNTTHTCDILNNDCQDIFSPNKIPPFL